jgi:hypothetical protein
LQAGGFRTWQKQFADFQIEKTPAEFGQNGDGNGKMRKRVAVNFG